MTVIADALNERIALMAPARRLRLAQAVELVERRLGPRRLRVLDAGCGDGLLALAMARRHRDWSIVGVDLRADLLSGASARAEARALANLRFVHGDLTRPLPVSDFDVVLAIECLEEIPDDRGALSSMVQGLSPGGLLVIHVPERDWRPLLPGSDETWRHEVRHGYEAAELERLLVAAGLERVEIQPTYRNTATLAQELRDRIKTSPLAVRAGAFPLMAGAVRLERAGLTWGSRRALLAAAWKPGSPPRAE